MGDFQRFGRVSRTFGGGQYGELRKQRRAPHKEILFILVKVPNSTNLALKAIQSCTGEQITDVIQRIGDGLAHFLISQADAEYLLDACYAELMGKHVLTS